MLNISRMHIHGLRNSNIFRSPCHFQITCIRLNDINQEVYIRQWREEYFQTALHKGIVTNGKTTRRKAERIVQKTIEVKAKEQ